MQTSSTGSTSPDINKAKCQPRQAKQVVCWALTALGLTSLGSWPALGQASHRPPGRPAMALPSLPSTQAGADVQVIYGGQAPGAGGFTLTDWGGGTAASTSDHPVTPGAHCLQIVTAGPYAGGKIEFAAPVALGDLGQEAHRYMQLWLQVSPAPGNEEFPGTNEEESDQSASAAISNDQDRSDRAGPRFELAQYPGTLPPGRGGFPGGPGFPGRGGIPGGPFGPGAGQPGASSGEENPGLPIKTLHLVFTLSDGTQADIMRPVPQTDTGWIRVGLPLAALPFPSGTMDARMKSLTIAADAPATVYVGEIRLLNDSTPISAFPPDEQDVAAGDVVSFAGSGDGGASSLRYTWDFDTKGAFVPEADGQNVTHVYKKSGDYTVTLMVSDIDGIKKSTSATTIVHVED